MTAALDPTLDFVRLPDGPEREQAVRAAYQALFGTALGRIVLRDILDDAGVGKLLGAQVVNREYQAGDHDRALKIMDLAGFDAATLHDNLISNNEGYFDERTDD